MYLLICMILFKYYYDLWVSFIGWFTLLNCCGFAIRVLFVGLWVFLRCVWTTVWLWVFVFTFVFWCYVNGCYVCCLWVLLVCGLLGIMFYLFCGCLACCLFCVSLCLMWSLGLCFDIGGDCFLFLLIDLHCLFEFWLLFVGWRLLLTLRCLCFSCCLVDCTMFNLLCLPGLLLDLWLLEVLMICWILCCWVVMFWVVILLVGLVTFVGVLFVECVCLLLDWFGWCLLVVMMRADDCYCGWAFVVICLCVYLVYMFVCLIVRLRFVCFVFLAACFDDLIFYWCFCSVFRVVLSWLLFALGGIGLSIVV